jgi:hypothetical protein
MIGRVAAAPRALCLVHALVVRRYLFSHDFSLKNCCHAALVDFKAITGEFPMNDLLRHASHDLVST